MMHGQQNVKFCLSRHCICGIRVKFRSTKRYTNTAVMKVSSGWLYKHQLPRANSAGAMKGCYFGKRSYVKSGGKLLGLQIDRAEVWRRFRLYWWEIRGSRCWLKISLPMMLCSLIQVYRRLGLIFLLHPRGITWIWYDIWYDIFVNCNWVVTRWQ